jgi:tetratricopeptide (TPR) repeat protein
MRLILFITLQVLFCLTAFSQDEKLIKKADGAFEAKNYTAALTSYELALQQNKDNPYVNFMIAKCYLITSPKEKAINFAGAAVRKSKPPTNEMYFVYAQALHLNQRWD